MRGRWWGIGKAARGYVMTLAAIGLAALIANKSDELLNTLNISLIYLFVVLVAATTYGYGPAIMASILGVLAFYTEFYPPFGFNTDLQPEDWFTLVFFLAFAVAISRLASSVRARAEEERRRAAEATARQHEAHTLQQLSHALQVGDDLEALSEAIARQLRTVFGLQDCKVLLIGAEGSAAPVPSGAIDVPLARGSETQGMLRLIPGDHPALDETDLRVLRQFADQAAAVIERARLATEARAAAVLREADRLKTALLRTISHDLRTPLATIKARTSSLLEGDVSIEIGEWRESMRAIDLEADRLERLVREVLDLCRLEAGVARLPLEPYSAEEVISTVLPHLERAAKDHRLVLDLDPDLPAVPLDITLIHQTLTNLLENAFKYAPAGSTVRLSAAGLDGGLLFRVSDEGPGIPSEQRERVFDAFYRLRRPVEGHTTGAGLGLAICRAVISAHHGWIRVEESSSGGTALLVWLPGYPAGPDDARVSRPRPLEPATGSALVETRV